MTHKSTFFRTLHVTHVAKSNVCYEKKFLRFGRDIVYNVFYVSGLECDFVALLGSPFQNIAFSKHSLRWFYDIKHNFRYGSWVEVHACSRLTVGCARFSLWTNCPKLYLILHIIFKAHLHSRESQCWLHSSCFDTKTINKVFRHRGIIWHELLRF